MTPGQEQARAVRSLVEPVLAELGVDLEELTLTPAGRRRVLRLVVDTDGGVSLDDVAEVSRRVSAVLDGSDLMGAGAYVLEVTSPGVDRPLTLPRHWRRAHGRLVTAVRLDGSEVEGRVVGSDESGALLAGSDGPGPGRVELADLRYGVVHVEFNRPAGWEDEPDPAAGEDDHPAFVPDDDPDGGPDEAVAAVAGGPSVALDEDEAGASS